MIRADFHIHTTASDGQISPQNIVSEAVKAGLTHIAITDHDTVDGLLLLENHLPSELKIIAGIEFSANMSNCEVHILGYGIDIHHFCLRQQLSLLKNDRLNRIQRMAIKITELGYPIDEQNILAAAKDATTIGRPHVAKALVAKGYFSSVADVFQTLLNHDKPGYVPHYKMTPAEVITLIHQTGGVSVLAHPGLVGNDKQVFQIIEAGINGIEVYHPKHDYVTTARYLSLAKEHGLLITGGSDYHAISGRFPQRLGEFTVPENIATTFINRMIRSNE